MDKAKPEVSEKKSQISLISISDLFSQTFTYYRKNISLIIGLAAVPFIFSAIELVASLDSLNLILFPIWIINAVVTTLFTLALYKLIINKETSVKKAYRNGLKLFWPFIWISIISGIVIFGGFVLLIIPGIFLSIALGFSSYLLFDENKKGISAIAASWHYVRGNWWAVFFRIIVFSIFTSLISITLYTITGGTQIIDIIVKGSSVEDFGLSIVGQYLDLILTYFLITPISIIYSFEIYNSLKQNKKPITPAEEKKYKKWVKIFSLIGVITIILYIIFLVSISSLSAYI